MKAAVFTDILDRIDRGESPELTLIADDKTYVRRFEKTDRLILLGCGHVALDVYRLAKTLDFDVIVVDDRPSFANYERFPNAAVICDDFVSAIRRLQITEQDYVCTLTRGHLWDAECIRTILSGAMPYYLGLISSRRRAAGLREILAAEGFRQEDIDRIHAPIGMPIGAMTTAEIAVSICAELIQERRRIRMIPSDNTLELTNADADLLRYLGEASEPHALVTVLSSTGSTPVKSGSMMAVNQLGAIIGTIGGGCGEAAAIQRARRIIGTGKNAVLSIDMSSEVAADNDMVCGGCMTVLIEDIS